MAAEKDETTGTPDAPSTPGAPVTPPEQTITFAWPTVDPADGTAPAAGTAGPAPTPRPSPPSRFDDAEDPAGTETADVLPPPRRRPRHRLAAAAVVVVAAVGVGGATLALNGREPAPGPAPTAAPAPTTSPTPRATPATTLVARGLLTTLDDVLAALLEQVDTSDALWARTDGQVTDTAARDGLRAALDAASAWATGAWEPHDASHARDLAAQGRAHLETIDALTATVSQDHDAWVAAHATAGLGDPARADRPGAGTPRGASPGHPAGPATDPGAVDHGVGGDDPGVPGPAAGGGHGGGAGSGSGDGSGTTTPPVTGPTPPPPTVTTPPTDTSPSPGPVTPSPGPDDTTPTTDPTPVDEPDATP